MGIIDMITGQNPNQGAIDASTAAAGQATAAQNALIQGALLPAYQELLTNYQQNYAPLQGGVSSKFQQLLGSNNAPQFSNLTSILSSNPALLQTLTGINALGVGQNDVNYLSNPGGTLSGQVTPMALSQFLNQAQNGLDPAVIGSALNTQRAQGQSMINSLRNSVGAGTPNIAGLVQDLNLQNEQGLTGTESSLAGMNQGVRERGMLEALNAAGGLDAQTMNMLSQAWQVANGANNNAFNNVFTGANFQQGLLGDITNYTGQGIDSLTRGTGGISQIANLYGNAASGAAGNATNLANAGNAMNSNTFSGLANLAGMLFGG